MTLCLYCLVAAETQFVETATMTTIMQHDKLLDSAQRGLVGEEGSKIKASMKQWEENVTVLLGCAVCKCATSVCRTLHLLQKSIGQQIYSQLTWQPMLLSGVFSSNRDPQ